MPAKRCGLLCLALLAASCSDGKPPAPPPADGRWTDRAAAADLERPLERALPDASPAADLLGPGADLLPVCPAGSWCSQLYPPGWTPSLPPDAQGRFLHDFSHAGYRRGEKALPVSVPGPVVDAVKQHLADPSGAKDSTAALQAAIDAVAAVKGGVVLIPAGSYRVDGTLRVEQSGTVIRGEGPGKTVLRFSRYQGMSGTAHLTFSGTVTRGPDLLLAKDAAARDVTVEVVDPGGLKVGDAVALGWVITPDFVTEHQMTGVWYAGFIGAWKPIFRRTVMAVDAVNRRVTLDVPLRYAARLRDQASLRKESGYLSECGLERLSVSNAVGWGQAWAQDQVAAVELVGVSDGWVKEVHSSPSPLATGYGPGDQTAYHLQSGGLRVRESRRVSIVESQMRAPQHRGDGGNGYLFELRSSSEILVKNCLARDGRHNFIQNWDFGLTGCVFSGIDSAGSTLITLVLGIPVPWPARCEYHHALAMANLVEDSLIDDGWEARNRGSESSGAGHTATGSVFWNLRGNGRIVSKQYGWGYLIGTGPGMTVDTGLVGPAAAGTAPEDFVEGAGLGATLFPASLYQHQLARRLASP